MLNHFTFDGKNSKDFGLYISAPGVYSAPKKDVTMIEVPGRNGTLAIDNDRYSNVNVSYSAFIKDNLPQQSRNIKAWLNGSRGYQMLFDSYDRDFFRMALFHEAIDMDTTYHLAAELEITFDCQPMRYSFAGQYPFTLVKSSNKVINPFAFASKPYIKVKGSGNILLAVNEKTLQLFNVKEEIELDCEMQNAFLGNINQNKQVYIPEYPAFLPGENLISFEGDVREITIIPRWCTL